MCFSINLVKDTKAKGKAKEKKTYVCIKANDPVDE